MTALLLALGAAGSYGLSDFWSGVLSRRHHYLWVALVGQLASTVIALVVALVTTPGGLGGIPSVLSGAVIGWGLLAAVGNAFGSAMLMKGLGEGAMHVAGPLSAVLAAGLPVLLGLALGERPAVLALVGIAVALPAVWLVAGFERGAVSAAGVREGVLAGVGFAVFFIVIAQAGDGAGAWPVAVCQVGTALATAGWVSAARAPGSVRGTLGAVWPGAAGGTAALLYFFATREGLLTVVAVVTSLYPAVTVLLAGRFLHERPSRAQLYGLGLAAAAVVAIAMG